MKTLVKALAQSLLLDIQAPLQQAPFVYTGAIRSDADLASSLPGIITLTQAIGFTLHPETLYTDDGCSATYHVDHHDQPVSLAVHCHPGRQTVAVAVSGLNTEEARDLFEQVETTLFGTL